MYSLVDYIRSWWSPPADIDLESSANFRNIVTSIDSDIKRSLLPPLVSPNDLLSVKLKPPDDIIPAPARNMPSIDPISLYTLNKAQLQQILSVKLKKVPKRPRKKYYEPRHPVLRELLQTRERV